MKTGVVIPVGAGRAENLEASLIAIDDQDPPVEGVVVVFDGEDAICPLPRTAVPVVQHVMRKHEPGFEQPRNVGVRVLERQFNDRKFIDARINHVWFIDSDVVVVPDAHESIIDARESVVEERVIVCPYDWLPENIRPDLVQEDWYVGLEQIRTDYRWVSFDQYGPQVSRRDDLAAGLACFSGNLVWPLAQFKRVGGFWNDLHHGRCEDGELGVRAVAMGIPIGFASEARGFHLYHPINTQLQMERNVRDVPLLNSRHPWIEGADLFVVEEDGKRFDVRCAKCGWSGNTAEWWNHGLIMNARQTEQCGIDIPVAREAFNF